MRTYSEPEIEEYIAQVLAQMPWPNGRPPITAANSARFIVLHVLKREGITLRDDNTIWSKRGHLIGTFGSASWKAPNHIEWSYLPISGSFYVVSNLRIEE